MRYRRSVHGWAVAATAVAALSLTQCANQAEDIALGVVGTTAIGAQTPSDEIEVIYYLGVFDPQGQLPPTVYRVRVHGQASFINSTKFASGWVRSELIDSLNSGGQFDNNGGITVDQSNTLGEQKLQTGRRLVMFGPEGFREAPRDHRLVIVMGADPSAYFAAVDEALGDVAKAKVGQQNSDLVNKLFLALAQVKGESDRLGDLSKNVATTFPSSQ